MAFLNDEDDGDLVLDVPTIDANELAQLMQSSMEPTADDHAAAGDVAAAAEDATEAIDGDDLLPHDRSGSDDDDDDEPEDPADGGGGGEGGNEASAEGVDDASLLALGKKEAKRMGKKLYKRWKKLHKRSKKVAKAAGSGGAAKEKHSKKKRGSEKERSAKDDDGDGVDAHGSGKRQRNKRHREDPEVDNGGGLDDAAYAGSSSNALSRQPPAPRKERAAPKAKHQGPKLSAEQKQELYARDAAVLVARMREARIADEHAHRLGQPPLHRISIMDEAALVCRRKYMHQALVAEGILDELSNWLYDATRQELGPLDLRSLALELLSQFEVRGMLHARKEDEEFDEAKAKVDDLSKYRGICREDLEATSLGLAVNRVRTHPLETQTNKVLATQLLQRLSRGFKYRRDDDDDDVPTVEVLWKCKGDATVAPPFDPVTSASDAFQRRMFQPDPLDPMSYLRMPPPRYQKGYVTNLSHIQVERKK